MVEARNITRNNTRGGLQMERPHVEQAQSPAAARSAGAAGRPRCSRCGLRQHHLQPKSSPHIGFLEQDSEGPSKSK